MNKFLEPIIREFIKTVPKVEYAFAYGSAVSPQKGYDYKNKKLPMVDLIFAVNDIEEWHNLNLKMNKNHYSGLSYFFGGQFIRYMNVNFFPIHFSPFIPFQTIKLKYGVVSSSHLNKDLESWRWFTLPGRMQKPIAPIVQEMPKKEVFEAAYWKNLESAIAVSLLLDYKPLITEQELFYTIMSLSYYGDLRMKYGAENQNKVENILTGNYDNIRELYKTALQKSKHLKDVVLYNQESEIFTIQNPDDSLIKALPSALMSQIMSQGKDTYLTLKMMNSDTRSEVVKLALQKKNQFSSRRMLIYHLITISPWLNLKYLIAKLRKRWSK